VILPSGPQAVRKVKMNPIKPHILIIEDDEDTRFVYSVILQMEGYLVTNVGSISAGLWGVIL
jgi:DNA-binding NtrC family response regulator